MCMRMCSFCVHVCVLWVYACVWGSVCVSPHMWMYMYVCTWSCKLLCVCKWVQIIKKLQRYLYEFLCFCVCIHVCMYVLLAIYMCACVLGGICLCMWMCISVPRPCVYTCVCVHTFSVTVWRNLFCLTCFTLDTWLHISLAGMPKPSHLTSRRV